MSTSTEKFPLTEIAEGRIDDTMFYEFLNAYGYYWHNCHAEGRIEDAILNTAEKNAIKYAKEKGLHLEFGEMVFALKSASEPTDDRPTGTECSCYAPTYLELSLIVEQAIEHISTMWPKEPEDIPGVAKWIKRTKRFRDGSQRVIAAKRKLYEIYDHSLMGIERERDIHELLRCYRHLFYFLENQEYDTERNTTRFHVKIFIGDMLPPSDEYGITAEEVLEYSRKILERMLDLNMLTEVETDDCGEMTLWINEPETWS